MLLLCSPLLVLSPEGSLLLVVRKFNLIFCRFFVMNITGVAATQFFEMVYEHKVTSLWNMEYLAGQPDFVGIQRIVLVEFNLIEWLGRWTERLVYLVSRVRVDIISRRKRSDSHIQKLFGRQIQARTRHPEHAWTRSLRGPQGDPSQSQCSRQYS